MHNVTHPQANTIKIMPHFHVCQNDWYQKDNNKGREGEGKGEPSCTVGGSANGAPLLENSRKVPHKVKRRTTL